MTVIVDDGYLGAAEFGPAMSALSPRRQRFVLALLDQDGRPNYTRAAKAAGYSDVAEGAKVRAHELIHNARVIAALHEEAGRRFRLLGWLGVRGLAVIAADRKHPDNYKANKDLADRFGFMAVTKHEVTVERKDLSPAAVAERIKQVAALLGVDATKLLGANAVPALEAEFEVVPTEERGE